MTNFLLARDKRCPAALMDAHSVIALTEMPPQEQLQRIARARLATKDFACAAVASYMRALNVSREDMLRYFERPHL